MTFMQSRRSEKNTPFNSYKRPVTSYGKIVAESYADKLASDMHERFKKTMEANNEQAIEMASNQLPNGVRIYYHA